MQAHRIKKTNLDCCNNLITVSSVRKICSLLSACIYLMISTNVEAEEFFNPAFLSNDPNAVADLSRFSKGEGQAKGNYRVEVYLNDEYVSTRDIQFNPRKISGKSNDIPVSQKVNNDIPVSQKVNNAADEDDTGLDPCITRNDLERLSVNVQAYPELAEKSAKECVRIADVIPLASTRFDFEKQSLYISIPQAALKNNIRGYIPPDEWDQGINALLLNYNFTGSNAKVEHSSGSQSAYFLGLNSGLNMGAWRLRNYSTFNVTQGNGVNHDQWQNVSTYVERTIIPLKGSLILGDSYTSNDIFDSFGFRGAQLASDDNMLPDSIRGFAPTVRGIASGNAKVTIKQNGYLIYQTYVPPGAFEISDLYPTSSSGDLQVTVTESNGKNNTFVVPYSAVPVLQREGRVKYSLTAGKYRSNGLRQDKPSFGQGTVIWGLPKGITVYGGTQLADKYKSFSLGSGVNLGDWGAISADVTRANSTLSNDKDYEGQSFRFLYAKSLNDFGTNFQLLGYRYSTEGYYSFNETTYHKMKGYINNTESGSDKDKDKTSFGDYYNLKYTKKGKVQINVTQNLNSFGSVFVMGSIQSYWHTDEKDELWQVGYNAYWKDVSYSLSYSYSKNPGFKNTDKRLALNISLPIGKWLSGGGKGADITSSNNTAYATYSANTDMHGSTTNQAGLSGTLLDEHNLSYSVQQGYGNRGVGGSGNAGLSYQGVYGKSDVGFNYSKGYKQFTYGVSGGIVGHSNGITLSQPLGDTNILIKAPGASGVNVENTTGINTDWRGYAVVPYATTYRLNRIALDTNTLSDDADLDNTVVNVVPTHGALVRADFDTRIGARALITLTYEHGKAIPFGATVEREDGNGGGIVGDNGQVYLSGLPLSGKLRVKWGSADNQSCLMSYSLPEKSVSNAVSYAKAECR